MTIKQIKAAINGLSEAQARRFNQTCSTKLYDEYTVMLSQQDQDEADDLSIEVDGLSSGELEDLNNSLSAERKLSKRPC